MQNFKPYRQINPISVFTEQNFTFLKNYKIFYYFQMIYILENIQRKIYNK